MSTLEQLPDELMLEVFEHLKPIPAYEARNHLNHCEPRLEENVRRTGLIYNTCLVSKRFWGFAEPTLYSSLTLYTAGWSCYQKLFCLVFALLQKPARVKHVRYLESVTSIMWPRDYDRPNQCYHIRGWAADCAVLVQAAKDFWQGEALDEWIQCLRREPGRALFALVVTLSPNVTHLTVYDSNWCTALSALLFFERSALPLSWFHGFPKLSRICFFTDRRESDRSPVVCDTPLHILDLPALRHYQHQGLREAHLDRWFDLAPFRNLVTLRLEDCQLPIQKVAAVVQDCHLLQNLVCTWFEERYIRDRHWPSLLSALEGVNGTLRHLDLRFGPSIRLDPIYVYELEDFENDSAAIPQPGSYAGLSMLKSLSLTDVMLVGPPRRDQPPNARPEWPISSLLPSKVERLIVETNYTLLRDDSLALQDLVHDLHMLPALKLVEIQERRYTVPFTTSNEKTADLIAQFNSRGVAFKPLNRRLQTDADQGY